MRTHLLRQAVAKLLREIKYGLFRCENRREILPRPDPHDPHRDDERAEGSVASAAVEQPRGQQNSSPEHGCGHNVRPPDFVPGEKVNVMVPLAQSPPRPAAE